MKVPNRWPARRARHRGAAKDTPVPEVIARYFEADARRDIDTVVALFTDEAVVIDEDQTWQGTTRIRQWREGPAATYRYTTELTGVQATGMDRFLVTGRLEGDFPGGTADLTWRFIVDGDHISLLQIAP